MGVSRELGRWDAGEARPGVHPGRGDGGLRGAFRKLASLNSAGLFPPWQQRCTFLRGLAPALAGPPEGRSLTDGGVLALWRLRVRAIWMAGPGGRLWLLSSSENGFSVGLQRENFPLPLQLHPCPPTHTRKTKQGLGKAFFFILRNLFSVRSLKKSFLFIF